MSEMDSETVEAIASVSEQHAMRGLERVGQALESKGKFAARDFQSWTGGVRNLVTTARELRRPDGPNIPGAAGSVNIFFVRPQSSEQATPPAEPRNVTPGAVSTSAPAIELANGDQRVT